MLCSAAIRRQCLIKWTRHASTTTNITPRSRGRPRKTVAIETEQLSLTPNVKARRVTEGERNSGEDVLSTTITDLPKKRGRPPGSGKRSKPCAVGLLHDTKPSRVDSTEDRAPRVALLQSSLNHHDLASFLEHASRTKLKTTTSVYKGTYYEYTAAEALKTYNFDLRRIGRSNDLGIDLLGIWRLPQEPRELKVLIQCKMSKPSPSMVRELEGAYVGAPAGWRGNDVMGMLISVHPTTAGVRESMQRSRLPLCFAQITATGEVLQFLWNSAAKETRLTGMSATTIYDAAGASKSLRKASSPTVQGVVSLLWLGKPWKGKAQTMSTSIREILSQSHQNSVTTTTPIR